MNAGNRTPEASALLQLGADVFKFGYWLGSGDGNPCPSKQALALVFQRLAAIGDIEILSEAMQLYNELTAERQAGWDHQRRAQEEEYAEQLRRHEIAITVECPYCGAAPGDVCRTAGPTGLRHSKGSGDHKDRYRLAKQILDQPPEVAP